MICGARGSDAGNFLKIFIFSANIEIMDLEFNKREDQNKLKFAEINRLLAQIKKGGGEQRLQKQRDEGKLTARERIEYLLDKNSESIEIGAFAGFEMYEEHGGCPGGGVIVVMGYVSGKQCLVVR